MMAVPMLVLKKDGQVMVIKNQSSEDSPMWLVNGLVGRVFNQILCKGKESLVERYEKAMLTS